jgi:hypothetical protein
MKLEWIYAMIETHKPNEIRMASDVFKEFKEAITLPGSSPDLLNGVSKIKYMGVEVCELPWWLVSGKRYIEFVHYVDDVSMEEFDEEKEPHRP